MQLALVCHHVASTRHEQALGLCAGLCIEIRGLGKLIVYLDSFSVDSRRARRGSCTGTSSQLLTTFPGSHQLGGTQGGATTRYREFAALIVFGS